MDQNPYINASLPATREGVCDPAVEVESRLATLADILAGRPPNGDESLAYDLLATVAWLERVRPEILQSLDPDDLAGQARRRIEAEGEVLAERALGVPNPVAWIDEAETLRASYEEEWDSAERATLACRLIDDLDDAELAVWMAGRLGAHDPELHDGLDRCRTWLVEHPDAFLAAGVYIQAVGQALRPELRQADPKLAATADKVVLILQALDDMEAELTFRDVEPIDPGALWLLIERFAAGQPLQAMATEDDDHDLDADSGPNAPSYPYRAQEIFSMPVLPLAAEGGEPEWRPAACEWQSPDERFLACLYLYQPPASEHEDVSVSFLDREGRPAQPLAGLPTRLGDCSSRVEARGQNVVAGFTWRALSRMTGELRLFVGTNDEEWKAVTDDT
ncbi:MAG: hypothetical protein ACYC61_03475 [Isosphaeraceae bacterium]